MMNLEPFFDRQLNNYHFYLTLCQFSTIISSFCTLLTDKNVLFDKKFVLSYVIYIFGTDCILLLKSMDPFSNQNLASTATATSSQTATLNLHDIVEDLFLVLTSKEKDVVIKRFSLDDEPRRTLEEIGQAFNVTRERVRQIEKIALMKLRRTVSSTKLNEVALLAKELLNERGGVMLETSIVNEILKRIYSSSQVDVNIIKLVATIDKDLLRITKHNDFYPFWKLASLPLEKVEAITLKAIEFLNKKGDVIKQEKLVSDLEAAFSEEYSETMRAFLMAAFELDRRMKMVDGCWGLSVWRHVNPKSIRDKAYIVLKKAKKPLHFIEIANRIAETGFDKKVVTNQAVHNELIRYDQFVLVGRGLYALREWGYKDGTVADIIERLLKEKSPLTKQEIIEGVLKQRYVKKGTISLNLQKNTHFTRVGRAVYAWKAIAKRP